MCAASASSARLETYAPMSSTMKNVVVIAMAITRGRLDDEGPIQVRRVR